MKRIFRKLLCLLGQHEESFFKEECHCNDSLAYWGMSKTTTICCNSMEYHWRSKCKHCHRVK